MASSTASFRASFLTLLLICFSLTTASPRPKPQTAAPTPLFWTLISDNTFQGKRLDAIDGNIFVAFANPDTDPQAVIGFSGNGQAVGPYPGQVYFIDPFAALRYTQSLGEAIPAGSVTSGLYNAFTPPDPSTLPNGGAVPTQGMLMSNYSIKGWTACPSPLGGRFSGQMQVFANIAGKVGAGGTGGGCTGFGIVTVAV